MAEYIEREAVMEKISAEQDENSRMFPIKTKYESGYHVGYHNGLSMAYAMLVSTPAADVVERKRGRWAVNSNGDYFCTNCSERPSGDCYGGCVSHLSKFCPSCGADMREDTE